MRLVTRRWIFAAAAAALAIAATMSIPPSAPQAEESYRLSGPFVHENLAIYLVHGPSAEGPVPLTLAEALEKGSVVVRETGNVNALEIENTGDEAVFVQSGDMVKGGRQDRVFTTSLLLKPKSGAMPIDAFCVEQGRWAQRGSEVVDRFVSAAETMPSREAKLAMKAPIAEAAQPAGDPAEQRVAQSGETSIRQQAVWSKVANAQRKLSEGLGESVAAPESATSMQLALENKKLEETRGAYIAALEGVARDGDVVGYVFAINGKLNSADIYPSNGLFKKMWKKLIQASAAEAIGERASGAGEPTPSAEEVTAFLKAAESGATQEKSINETTKLATRDSDKAVYFETRAAANSGEDWVHKNYIAK